MKCDVIIYQLLPAIAPRRAPMAARSRLPRPDAALSRSHLWRPAAGDRLHRHRPDGRGKNPRGPRCLSCRDRCLHARPAGSLSAPGPAGRVKSRLDRHSVRPLSGADGSRGQAGGINREHGEDDPNGAETVAAPATVSGEVLPSMPLVRGPGRPASPSTRKPGDLPSSDTATGRGVPGSVVTPSRILCGGRSSFTSPGLRRMT